MGFEPMNLVLTKDALYQLSYSSIVCLRLGTLFVSPVGRLPTVLYSPPVRPQVACLAGRNFALPPLFAEPAITKPERVKGIEPS